MSPNDPSVGRPDGESQSLELLADGEGEWWTIVPAEATGDARLTRWLSVAREDLCDLEEWR